MKVRPEQEPPRRVTIRRRKKPTSPPETQVVSTPPREERLEIVPQVPISTPPRSTLNPVPVIPGPISGINPLNPAPIAPTPVTQPPGNFMFMRIGGYGFDNGEVPTGIEPPKQMLPELVPAGVRVRTPSGVVVSVRGQPGLYGIHPTPPPDASHGPRKPAPKPEIVYLTQKPTSPPQMIKTIPVAPVLSVPKPPTATYTQNIRAERPPTKVRIDSPEPTQRGDLPSRNPGQYIQSPQPRPVPQTRVAAQVPITPPSQPRLRQTVPRGPPQIVVENAGVRNQPGSFAISDVPVLQIPNAGQFGQRLRPLTRVNYIPGRINELAPTEVAHLVPSQIPPRRLRPQLEGQRLTQGVYDGPQQRPDSIDLGGPNAVLGPTRLVEPQLVIQEYARSLQPVIYQGPAPVAPKAFADVPSRVANAEPVDIKEPNLVRITSSNPLEPSGGLGRYPVGPTVQVTNVPATPRAQTLTRPPAPTQAPQVVIVQQRPVETLVDEQPQISGIPIQYESPVAQRPRIVLQQPVVVPNIEIQRIASPALVNVQQNVIPTRQRVPIRPPSSIPPSVNQRVPARPGNDEQIIIRQNVPTRSNIHQRNIQTAVPVVPQNNLGISSGPFEIGPEQQIVIGPDVPTRINVPRRNIQTSISGVPQNNLGVPLGSPEIARETLRPETPVNQKAVVTPPLLDKNQGQPENPNGFSFMRIGGFGFDSGVVPARFNVEPAKEMLPELVPAGVRVRTPSGVVVSVRGRPGLYGIHPTPAPDTSIGPTKKPPRPEIVYLHQTTRRPTPASTARPSPVVPGIVAPIQYGTRAVVERPGRIPASPLNVIEEPQRVVKQPLRTVELPQRVVDQPLRILEQPQRVVDQPLRVVEQPQRVVEQPLRIVVQPQRVVEQPLRIVEQPQRIVKQPLRVVEVPRRVVEQPLTIIEQPRRVLDQPLRVVEQPIQVPVAPQLVFTQVPQRVISQVPQRVFTQVPQRLVVQVPQRVVNQEPQREITQLPQRVIAQVPQRLVSQEPQREVTQVPQRVIAQVPQRAVSQLRVVTQVPQTVLQPVQLSQTPVRAIPQPPQLVTPIPRRDSAVAQGPQTLVLPSRSPLAQEQSPVRPRIELQRVETPSAVLPATKAPGTSTGSGSYGNDLSDFEDFEPSPEPKQQPAIASRETRVSSGVISGEPKVVAGDVSQSENSNGVNLSSNGAEGPVNVVIGNIEEGPYNFHHRHTHGNGFAFVKLGVPFYQKMEADIVAVSGPPVYARPAFQGDGSGVVVKKSRRKSS